MIRGGEVTLMIALGDCLLYLSVDDPARILVMACLMFRALMNENEP